MSHTPALHAMPPPLMVKAGPQAAAAEAGHSVPIRSGAESVPRIHFPINADAGEEASTVELGSLAAHAPWPVSAAMATSAAMMSAPGKALLTAAASSVGDLSDMSDPDIVAFLDPSNISASTATLLDWPQSKLQRLIDYVRPVHFHHILQHSVRDGTQALAEALTFLASRTPMPKATSACKT